MRVLMLGRGVIATIYGSVLASAGHDVTFYVRPGRRAQYGESVHLDLIGGRRSPTGKRVQETFPTTLTESLSTADPYDLVVVSVGHHRLAEAAAFLAPRIGEATVLILGNVWDEPLAVVAPLSVDRVVFGFPQAGGGFDDDGVLHGALFTGVTIGVAGETPSPAQQAVMAVFRQAGLKIREQSDMRGWLFLHFVADAGMFAQGVRSGSMARMIGDRHAFRAAFLTSRELLPVLEARGVDLRRHRAATVTYRFPTLMATTSAWATSLLPIARGSLAAHTNPDAVEARAVIDDARHTAHALGIATPLLDA